MAFDAKKIARAIRPEKPKAAPPAAPPVAASGPRKVGLKKVGNGHEGVGTVTELRGASEYAGHPGLVAVEVRHGEIPTKGDGKRDYDKPHPPTSRFHLSEADAEGLSVGGKVKIRVERHEA